MLTAEIIFQPAGGNDRDFLDVGGERDALWGVGGRTQAA